MRKAYLHAAIALILMMCPVSLLSQTSPASGAQVAILDSSIETKAYFGIHYPKCTETFPTEICGQPIDAYPSGYLGPDEYQRYLQGWIYTLGHASALDQDADQSPIAFDIIHDVDLTDLRLGQYKVLILPNTPSISDEHAKTIRQWVIRGGRLLATFGAGYKQIQGTDMSVFDTMKLQEGGTNGLHQLWKDPMSKMVSSGDLACTTESLAAGDKTCCNDWPYSPDRLTCDSCIGVNVRISRYEGPTAKLEGKLTDDLLDYRGMGNLLVQRPEGSDRVYAFLKFYNTPYDRPSPAIIVSDQSKGRVAYFAFAPEFDVSLYNGLPESLPIQVFGDPPKEVDAYVECVKPLTDHLLYNWGNVDGMMKLMRDTVRWLLESN